MLAVVEERIRAVVFGWMVEVVRVRRGVVEELCKGRFVSVGKSTIEDWNRIGEFICCAGLFIGERGAKQTEELQEDAD